MTDGNNHMLQDQQSLLVKVWDCGPDAPQPPMRPVPPEGKEGSPAHDLAMIEFKGELAKYETDLVAYGRNRKDHAEWHKTYGGPYELEMYSVNAREAIAIEPTRYFVSHSSLPNHGLPKGRKPGPWHAQEKERQAEQKRLLAQAAARDPVFGTQGASP